MLKTILNLYKLFYKAFNPYKKQIILLTFLALINALLEGIGINTLIPIFSYFFKDNAGENNVLLQITQYFFDFLNIDFSLKQLLIFTISIFILKAIIMIITNYIKINITTAYDTKIKSDLLKKTLKASWPYLVNQKIGHLENTIKIDTQKSASLLQDISGILITINSLIIYTIIALNISPKITLITLFFVFIMLLIFKPILKSTKNISQAMVELYKKSAHHINQSIYGIKTIKTTRSEKLISEKGDEIFNKIRKHTIKLFLIKHIPGSLLQPMGIIFICIVLGLSYKSENFNLIIILPTIYLINRIFEYGKRLQKILHNISETTPYLKSVLEYQETAQKNQEKQINNNNFSFREKIEFSNINFTYPNKTEAVLKNINLEIKKGNLIGVIGPSGGGKTTLVDLMLRLLQPNRGKILIDGKNIDKIDLKKWREKVGYVSQDIFLLNDTIANNIKFYNHNITKKEIEEAAKQANIYNFIQTLPNKFDTNIGENGALISMGQRQRVVIARILARKPEILILDEATSALDSESEIKIQKVIENLKGKITVIAIAHRLSTIVNSDKLLVLSDGHVSEQGKPMQLLKNKNTYFYKIYNIRNNSK